MGRFSKTLAAAKGETAATGEKKGRAPFQLPNDLLEKARDVAYWDRITLAALAEEGLRMAIEKRERQRGEPFPPRGEELRAGRPIRR